MYTYDTPTPVTAVVDIATGRVQLIAADRSDVTVEVRPTDPGKGRDVTAAEQTIVTFDAGVLRVATTTKHEILGPSGSVEVTVQVPAGSRVEARGAAVDLRGVGSLGDVVVDGAQAEIRIDEAASARINAQAGDVTIGRLAGDATITLQKGAIVVDEAVRGALVLSTQAGDIAVTTAPGTSATLDAGTAYGRVSNALHNGGEPAVTITATTSYGDITAKAR